MSDRAIENVPKLKGKRREYQLDFIDSQELSTVEEGIKETLRGIHTATLAVALAVHQIVKEALYAQAGYKTATEYFRDAPDRLNLPKQTVSDYRRIGEAFNVYRDRLEAIGFDPHAELHKLRVLEDALAIHRPADVWRKFRELNVRAFIEYAHPQEEQSERSDSRKNVIDITDDGIVVNGKLAVDVRAVAKIVDAGDEPFIVGVENDGEKRAITRLLKDMRQKR